MKKYPQARRRKDLPVANHLPELGNTNNLTFIFETEPNSKIAVFLLLPPIIIIGIVSFYVLDPLPHPNLPVHPGLPLKDLPLALAPLLLSFSPLFIAAGYLWYTLAVRRQGELTIYEDHLEFHRSGLFARHITLATHDIQTLRLELGAYPRFIPLTIRGQSQNIRLQLHRVRHANKVLSLQPWQSVCEHPLLILLREVTHASLESRSHFQAAWHVLEC
ncbi:MAG: hypothetical protein AAF267_04225 [Deinococcota bacterium]